MSSQGSKKQILPFLQTQTLHGVTTLHHKDTAECRYTTENLLLSNCIKIVSSWQSPQHKLCQPSMLMLKVGKNTFANFWSIHFILFCFILHVRVALDCVT